MISMVTFVWVPSAGISSVADDSEGKAQGHDRSGDVPAGRLLRSWLRDRFLLL